MSIKPITTNVSIPLRIIFEPVWRLTVKFGTPMHTTLHEGPVAFRHHHCPHLLCPAIHQVEDSPERDRHKRCDDRKGSVAPAPRAMVLECLSYLGTRKRIADERTAGNCDPNQTVLESASVCDEDIEDIGHAVHADPVEDLSCCICLDAVAEAHHDECWYVLARFQVPPLMVLLQGRNGEYAHNTTNSKQMAKP